MYIFFLIFNFLFSVYVHQLIKCHTFRSQRTTFGNCFSPYTMGSRNQTQATGSVESTLPAELSQ